MQRVTLADIARKTGLNLSTVSRALSRPGRVSEDTRRQVERAAADLGYAANIVARNLSRGTSDTIMVMAPNFADQAISPVFTEILLGVCNEADVLGFNVMIQRHPRPCIPTADVVKYLQSGIVDGVLLLATNRWDLTRKLWPGAQPPAVVSLMQDMTGFGLTSVTAQEAEGFSHLVAYLLKRGYRSFAYVSGPEETSHEPVRRRAVEEYLARNGLADQLVRLEGGPFDMASGARAGQAYLALPNRPRAVICCSDALAVGFMRSMIEAGLSVPDDVAVAGYDGLDYTAFVTPPLTTVSQPSEEIGRAAMQALADLLRGRSSSTRLITLSPELVVRNSA